MSLSSPFSKTKTGESSEPQQQPPNENKTMSTTSHRDLRRVFDHLAAYQPRSILTNLISSKVERVSLVASFIDNPNGEIAEGADDDDFGFQGNKTGGMNHKAVLVDEEGKEISKYQAPTVLQKLTVDLQELRNTEKKLVNSLTKSITIKDLDQSLRSLGRICTKKELSYMIWEVDENLDSQIDWSEFQLMFERNTSDTTGLEPFELFNIVQFMTYDEDFKGHITEDDTMSTLFARHGRENLESQMQKLFGEQLKAEGGEGILTLEQYLKAVRVRNVKKKEIEYTVFTSTNTECVGAAGRRLMSDTV